MYPFMLVRVHAFNLFSNVINSLQRCISLIKTVIITVSDATSSLNSSWVAFTAKHSLEV